MKLCRLLIVSVVSCFFLSSSVFSVAFERGGIYFSGRSASFVVKDDLSTINVRTEPVRGWECPSFVKDCLDPVVIEEKTTTNLNCAGCCCTAQDICSDIDDLCALVKSNSFSINVHETEITNNSNAIVGHEIRIDHIETLTQTIVDNSDWIVDHVYPDPDNLCPELGNICDFMKNNSDAIAGHEIRIDHIETLTQTIVDNSDWIVDHVYPDPDNLCPELGNICDFMVNLSISIVTHNSQIINNSNAIVITSELAVDNSIAINHLRDCCDNIATGICPELGDICEFLVNLSNSIVTNNSQIINNSNAIVACCVGKPDPVDAATICPELGNICEFMENNSDAIAALRDCCQQ